MFQKPWGSDLLPWNSTGQAIAAYLQAPFVFGELLSVDDLLSMQHLGWCMKPCGKFWDIYQINWYLPDFWSINSIIWLGKLLGIKHHFHCPKVLENFSCWWSTPLKTDQRMSTFKGTLDYFNRKCIFQPTILVFREYHLTCKVFRDKRSLAFMKFQLERQNKHDIRITDWRKLNSEKNKSWHIEISTLKGRTN